MEGIEESSASQSGNGTETAVRGTAKSGRWWKDEHKARHTAIYKSKPLKTSWEKKMELKAKQKQASLLQKEIRDKKAQERQERIQRAKEQEEKRLENERKAEVVQVIRNTAKLKATKKKQLRLIQKRDITDKS